MTSPSSPNPPIFLLKTKSSPHDNYEEYFSRTTHYEPTFIPVLEHIYHNDNIRAVIKDIFPPSSNHDEQGAAEGDSPERIRGPKRKYGGLIFTSQRAVEGFAKILEDEVPLQTSTPLSTSLKIYSVGPATSRSLTHLRDARLPHAEVIGHDCGTGEKLAGRILEDYNAFYASSEGSGGGSEGGEVDEKKPPLIFLMGKLHSDIIPKTLGDANLPAERRIGIKEMVVYETGVMGSFESEFSRLVKNFILDTNPDRNGQGTETRRKKKKIWVVVFSPTGCDAMLRVLNTLLPEEEGGGMKRYHIATIGPTTRDHLISKYGVQPEVCAEVPSPEGVGEGIKAFMERGEGG
ncbi:hypothetical protein FQN54_004670 [Arachnomyces sp. PD_36]|nr:hypothetical protein FQN54_004670 [Arachnomyces sp. PD_36]